MAQEQSRMRYPYGSDHHRSSDEIKRELDTTRSDLDDTIDALVEKLDPAALLSRCMQGLMRGGKSMGRRGRPAGDAIGEVGSSILHKIKENPVPAALIAVGAAWLLMEDETEEHLRSAAGEHLGAAAQATRRGVASAGGQVSSGAGSAASAMRSGARSAAHSTSEAAHYAADSMRSGSRRVARSARAGAQRSRESFDVALQDHPLAVGGAALGLGLLCGLLIPETEYEHQLMGERRDQLKSMGREALQRGREVATATASAAQQQMREEGLTPSEIGETARRVAQEARRAAEQKMGEGDTNPLDQPGNSHSQESSRHTGAMLDE